MGIWFWCTDQTIVQKVLGARTMRQGQFGAMFAAGLKIITPLIFFIPGIISRFSIQTWDNPDKAYMTMRAPLFYPWEWSA